MRTLIRKFQPATLIATVLILLLASPHLCAGEHAPELPANGQLPLEVRMGFNLINITDVSEKEETMDFEGALYLEWHDPTLNPENVTNHGNGTDTNDDLPGDRSHIYQGAFKVNETFPGWRPHVVIPNGIGDRVSSNMAIRSWPDGRVQYSEIFFARVETPMDLRRFPFDTQELEIYFHPFGYQSDELLLVPDHDLARSWNRNVGIAEWNQESISVRGEMETIAYFDDVTGTISAVVATVKIKRKPLHVVLTILLPMVVLVALTWCVFWMDAETLSNRVSITFIGILSVVTYYFVVFESLPEIGYLTFMDGFILATFLILAAGVVVAVLIETTSKEEGRETDPRINKVCRWAFPLTYAVTTCILGLIFFMLL